MLTDQLKSDLVRLCLRKYLEDTILLFVHELKVYRIYYPIF